MVNETQRKLVKKKRKPTDPQTVEVQVMDGAALTFPPSSFDTVVETFGLCSVEDPVAVLKEMQRVCKAEGKILLLEHGRAHYDWLNRILDKNVNKHVERWGCIWNRDIAQLVEESGLEVEQLWRFHLGTTYYIIARPAGSVKEQKRITT